MQFCASKKDVDMWLMDIEPKKIGSVGYCFGGKYVTQLLAGQIDAGYIAHPFLVTLEEFAAIKAPLSIAAAGTLFFLDFNYRGLKC
jgi:dienelactone hydrolase